MFICPEYGEAACASSLNEVEIVRSSSLDARCSRASKQYWPSGQPLTYNELQSTGIGCEPGFSLLTTIATETVKWNSQVTVSWNSGARRGRRREIRVYEHGGCNKFFFFFKVSASTAKFTVICEVFPVCFGLCPSRRNKFYWTLRTVN